MIHQIRCIALHRCTMVSLYRNVSQCIAMYPTQKDVSRAEAVRRRVTNYTLYRFGGREVKEARPGS